jgi:hypothetical protein
MAVVARVRQIAGRPCRTPAGSQGRQIGDVAAVTLPGSDARPSGAVADQRWLCGQCGDATWTVAPDEAQGRKEHPPVPPEVIEQRAHDVSFAGSRGGAVIEL